MTARIGHIRAASAGLVLFVGSTMAFAGEADVVAAKARKSGDGWNFDVTVAHADTGWDHYANGWEVVGPDGTVYGTRELLHPHVDEQPFTRSQPEITIPREIGSITIRAHDSVHGYGSKTLTVDVPH